MRSGSLVAVALTIAACADVPADPTYLDDVRPILTANCVRCHGPRHACGATEPTSFRLDTWDPVDDVRGVAAMSERVTVRAADQGTMPPSGALPDREREILRRWRRAGSPVGERLDNQTPTMTVLSTIPAAEPASQQLDLEYLVGDPDSDAVIWDIGWSRDGVEGWLVRNLDAGHGHATVDTGPLPSGTYQLVARLRDGAAAPVEVPIGSPLPIPDRDAAPSVQLTYPKGGEQLSPGQDVMITWAADDADTPGPLTADLSLVLADGTAQTIASGLDARTGAYTWTPTSSLAGDLTLQIVVSDGTATRSDRTSCSFAFAGAAPRRTTRADATRGLALPQAAR